MFPPETDNRDHFCNTPLMTASARGHVEIVKLLLEAGASVNLSNFSDYPSLHLPLHQIKLPENDVKLSTVCGSALDIAVIRGHLEIVSHLLQNGAKVHNIYYLLRSITLRLAGLSLVTAPKTMETNNSDWEKCSAVIRLLFSHDSDLIGRVQCTNPSTLYVACAFGVVEMASLLLELGTGVNDLYRTDNSGSSYWCSFITIISSGSLLSASKKTESGIAGLLCQVNWVQHSRMISLLSENGLDVNHRDKSESFALGIASREGCFHLVQHLLQCRADVNLQNGDGISSLMEATSSGHLEICLLLLRFHAKVDLLDSQGSSALMIAVAAGSVDSILLLLDRGAQINLQDKRGTSSLMLSCFAGDTRVTKLLLGHGAEPNLQNADGITALMMCCFQGHTELVELLMSHGADMSVVTSIGMTALRVSTDNGHKDITKLLIEYGASNPPCSVSSRKRTLSTRDFSTISPRVGPHVPDNSQMVSRLDRIEHILQTLLQAQGAASSTNKLDSATLKPSLRECLRILIPVAYDWKLIGTLLGLEYNSLETIKYDNHHNAKDCLQAMLHMWLVREEPATWEALAEAVQHSDQTIARKIRRIG